MEELKNIALMAENEEHLDIFSIIYFAKNCRKLLFYAYFYEDNSLFDKHYCCTKEATKKFIKDNKIIEEIFQQLAKIRKILDTDIEAMIEGDPVGPTKQEVILCYPGFEAICYYRIANLLYKYGYKLIARVISEYAHRKTQVDIHPGASIGSHFAMDHATGVVIGETANVGNYVRIYQGVTLGAKWLNDAKILKGIKRHPTIEDNTIIYANATILGGDTIIKKGSVIGANAFITKSN